MPNYKWVVFPFLFEKWKKTISPNLLSFSVSSSPTVSIPYHLLKFHYSLSFYFFFSLFGVVSKLKRILVYVLLYLCPLMGYKYLRNCLRLVTYPYNEMRQLPFPKKLCTKQIVVFW